MTQPELNWLADQAKTHSRIAELGSYKGRSTLALALNTSGWVLAVDHWRGPSNVILSDFERGKLFSDFKRNLGKLIGTKVFIHNADLSAYTPESNFPLVPYDMIFIDADHSYESVKYDIEIWSPHLAPGGLLCGHDYADFDPGVIRAVNELVPGVQVAPNTTIWFKVKE